jgi:hypothetical protein
MRLAIGWAIMLVGIPGLLAVVFKFWSLHEERFFEGMMILVAGFLVIVILCTVISHSSPFPR